MVAWSASSLLCSYCGRVFCDLCTMRRSLIRPEQILTNPARQYLPANAHNPQRVCDECHARLKPEQPELRALYSDSVATLSHHH